MPGTDTRETTGSNSSERTLPQRQQTRPEPFSFQDSEDQYRDRRQALARRGVKSPVGTKGLSRRVPR